MSISPAAGAEARLESAPAGPLLETARLPARRLRLPSSRALWGGLIALAVAAAALDAGVGRTAIVNVGGWPQFSAFFSAALHPRVDGGFLSLTAHAALTTLAYAVLGTALSVMVGLVGGVLSSQVWWRAARVPGAGRLVTAGSRAGWLGARAGLALPRGVHEVVWGLFLLSVLGINPLVAIIAIGLPFGFTTAKVFSEILDETPQAPFEALRASGASRSAAVLYGPLAQALPELLSYSFYRFECAIRSAAILGIVGAGGLGFQIAVSFQELHYTEMWTLIYALMALSGLADLWSTKVRGRRVAACRPASWTRPIAARPRRDRLLTGSVIAGAALVVGSLIYLHVGLAAAVSGRTWSLLGSTISSSFPPNLSAVPAHRMLALSIETLAMSVLAGGFAALGGVVLAFAAANTARLTATTEASIPRRTARLLTIVAVRAFLLVCRAIPPPVWALVVLFVLFPGVLPGAVALGLYNLGIVGRLMAEAVDSLDERSTRALSAAGASRSQAFLYGVLPAATPRFTAFAFYRWEVTIRETVVVGAVGAGGLGLLLQQQLASFDYRAALTTLIVLIVLTLIVDLLSAVVRRALR